MTTDGTTISERLLLAQRRAGVTQLELAAISDVSPATIRRIQDGDANPRINTLRQIAHALKVPLDWLLGLGGEHPKDMFERGSEMQALMESILSDPAYPEERRDALRRQVEEGRLHLAFIESHGYGTEPFTTGRLQEVREGNGR